MGSHIQFLIEEPGKPPSEPIELIQDAVCEHAARRNPRARIVSTTGHDVTELAIREFPCRRCP